MNGQTSHLQAIDERETARRTGRAVQSLRNDRHMSRGIPYCKLGRSVRYLITDIEDYLLKNRINPV